MIHSWPTLISDPLAASMSSSLQGLTQSTTSQEAIAMETSADVQSILVVADDLGHIHCFIDGSYPLGAISLGSELTTQSLFKHPNHPMFFSHPSVDSSTLTDLYPSTIKLPLLEKRSLRDLAKLSSTARSLVWYTIRVVKDMRAVWFGSDTFSGARELGPKWTRALEAKEKEQYGSKYACLLYLDVFHQSTVQSMNRTR
jgi:anaphase-promoting complex subunit 4